VNWNSKLRFNLWYFGTPPWDTGISPPELISFITSHPPGRALDLGCGTGTNVVTLAQANWDVTGIDYAFRAIQAARRRAQKAGVNVDLRVGSVTNIQGISPPLDLVLDIGCFHGLSIQERQLYLENLIKLLAPDGTFFVYAILKNPAQSTGIGIDENDLRIMEKKLGLICRTDGKDRGDRSSTWLAFQK
jgi:2-polyprenyl-3-methyl-5-hydroxy-6-metoxy-1,4-benzoquinol methylase